MSSAAALLSELAGLGLRLTPTGRGTLYVEPLDYAARWRDPDSGKVKERAFDPASHPTRESRRQWAIAKAESVAKRRAEIASGAPLRTHTPLSKAVEDYLETCANELRPATVDTYGGNLALLTEWAGESGIAEVEELSPGKLALFKQSLKARRKRRAVTGGKRGEKRSTQKRLSPSSPSKRTGLEV